MAEIYRLGHHIFKKLDHPVLVDRRTISAGLDLRSESGRVVHIDNVQKARTQGGRYVHIAPDGAVVRHDEHGALTLPQGVFTVRNVRDAVPEELSSRTRHLDSAQDTLWQDQLD